MFAQYTKLLDFSGDNGSEPHGSLISDGTFLYGMTREGGTYDSGIIFKVKPDGSGFTKLLDFSGKKTGKWPHGSLISDGIFLYGMTRKGGTYDSGIIFKIKPDGSGFTKLLDFSGEKTGKYPTGYLIFDGTFLYGMTKEGGKYNCGVIFKIKPDGSGFTKLLDFSGYKGTGPTGSLISDGTFLYGITYEGGIYGDGVIFKIKHDGSGFTKLLDFSGKETSSCPYGSLIFDGTFLYGMTTFGGTYNVGDIFKIKPDGSGFTKLLDFSGENTGKYPLGSLIFDGTFLYGMTSEGGTDDAGVIFKVKPDGNGFTKLLDFSVTANGKNPLGSLISDGIFLYGMTGKGGTNDAGVIFKYNMLVNQFPQNMLVNQLPPMHSINTSVFAQYTKLLDFSVTANGKNPLGSLISDGTFLYGMTYWGGKYNYGVIFKVKPDGRGFTKLLDFSGMETGKYPEGSLISDGTFLYGMTSEGGTDDNGVIFKVKPDGSGFTKLLEFDYSGEETGMRPKGSLISDGTFLYGMTISGGTNYAGVIFKVKPDGRGFTKLLEFDYPGEETGMWPVGSLISDGTFLYGMTEGGGKYNYGVIFKVKPDGSGFTNLLDFSGDNGKKPYGSLTSDGTFLYGMTTRGGTDDAGVIFKIKPDGSGFTKLLDFSGDNGKYPCGSLISDSAFLYGMTMMGGTNGEGIIFKVKPDGSGFTKLLNFSGKETSRWPHGSLISDGAFLYGMTTFGGTDNDGVIFKYYCPFRK